MRLTPTNFCSSPPFCKFSGATILWTVPRLQLAWEAWQPSSYCPDLAAASCSDPTACCLLLILNFSLLSVGIVTGLGGEDSSHQAVWG